MVGGDPRRAFAHAEADLDHAAERWRPNTRTASSVAFEYGDAERRQQRVVGALLRLGDAALAQHEAADMPGPGETAVNASKWPGGPSVPKRDAALPVASWRGRRSSGLARGDQAGRG
jgi:hypothetical protein